MVRHILFPAAALLLLAGCANDYAAPVSSVRSGPASQMPQSPNSLPLGSAVTAPLTPAQGTIGTTRVAPAY